MKKTVVEILATGTSFVQTLLNHFVPTLLLTLKFPVVPYYEIYGYALPKSWDTIARRWHDKSVARTVHSWCTVKSTVNGNTLLCGSHFAGAVAASVSWCYVNTLCRCVEKCQLHQPQIICCKAQEWYTSQRENLVHVWRSCVPFNSGQNCACFSTHGWLDLWITGIQLQFHLQLGPILA